MKKKVCSFAGDAANASIPELGIAEDDSETKRSPEDPAVFGGSATQLPEGTVVEFLEDGRYKVVE